MEPNTPTSDPASATINPLSAAFDAAIAGTPPGTNETSVDFIGSTLALMDGGDEPSEPAAEPASDTAAPAGEVDPLQAIDAIYPELDDKTTSPEAKARWGELKQELKAERSTLRSLKQELEELKSKSLYDPEEVTSLKKQVEEYNKELSIHRIEATREYQTAIDAPLRAIGESAASIARRYEIDQDVMFDALAETDEAKQQKNLSNLVDGMNDRDRLKIYQMADDTLVVLRKRDDMKANSHAAIQELDLRQRATQERVQVERQRDFSGHMDRLFEAFEDKIPFHPLNPNESKSTVLSKLKADALMADVASAGLDVQAYSSAAGVVLPRMIQQNRALTVELKAYKDRLAGLTGASPARAKASATGINAGAPSTSDFLESIFSNLPT